MRYRRRLLGIVLLLFGISVILFSALIVPEDLLFTVWVRWKLASDIDEVEAITVLNMTTEQPYEKWYPTYLRLSYKRKGLLLQEHCIELLSKRPDMAVADLKAILPSVEGAERQRAEDAIRSLQALLELRAPGGGAGQADEAAGGH